MVTTCINLVKHNEKVIETDVSNGISGTKKYVLCYVLTLAAILFVRTFCDYCIAKISIKALYLSSVHVIDTETCKHSNKKQYMNEKKN